MSPSAARAYLADAAATGSRYLEWLLPAEVASEVELPRGHGTVSRRRGKPVALYRDDDGRVHTRSAVCTPAGCIVHWNPDDRHWECPCHGSRFTPDGAVASGPATDPLAPVEGS